MKTLKNLFIIVAAWFKKTPTHSHAPTPVDRSKSDIKDTEENGQWFFRRDILDQLPKYMKTIKRMKKADKKGYQAYRKIGALIASSEQLLDCSKFEFSTKNLPSFGAVAFLGDASEFLIPLQLAYFTKLDRVPVDVEPSNGQVFRLVGYWDDIDDKKHTHGASVELYAAVSEDGAVTALRQRTFTHQRIHHKDKHSKRHAASLITHQRITHSPLIEDDPENPNRWRSEKTPNDRAATILRAVLNAFITGNSGVRVAASKDNVTAVFVIDMLRTPYFFSDREPVYAEGGHKKRIFHIVRTHRRRVKGKDTYVKTHFRGLRKFRWNGYRIRITVPGWHHNDIVGFTAGALEYAKDEEHYDFGETISLRKAAAIAAEHMKV